MSDEFFEVTVSERTYSVPHLSGDVLVQWSEKFADMRQGIADGNRLGEQEHVDRLGLLGDMRNLRSDMKRLKSARFNIARIIRWHSKSIPRRVLNRLDIEELADVVHAISNAEIEFHGGAVA